MSTLRINNIEAQSVPASPTIDEKVKVTNSSGDILVNIDGKTSGITTIGINTTDGNIKFDANSNVLITGILTATTLAGNFTPDSLEIGSNIKLGNAGVITATSFVGSGANLTGIDATKIITGNTQVQTIDTGSDGHVKVITEGSERLRITSAGTLLLGTSTGALANGNGIVIADATAARLSLKDTTNGVTGTDGFDVVQTGTDAYLYHRENGNMIFGTNSSEKLRITSAGDFGTNGVTPTTQAGRVFHLHAGATQQRFHMTNSTTGSGATDGFEILIDTETNANCRIRNFEAGYMAFDTGGSNNEVMRLDSSGRVMIGTTTEGHPAADNLTIYDSGNCGITIRSGTSNNGVIYFSDGSSGSAEYKGAVQYNHTDNYLRFYTNGEEKLRIDSTGRLLLGSGAAGGTKITGPGGLDVSQYGLSICMGGSAGSSGQARADATTKEARLVIPHYTNAEEPLTAIAAFSTSNVNYLNYGGGTSLGNVATRHQFYTAANTTTTGGSEKLKIEHTGVRSFATFVDTSYHANPDPLGDGSGIAYYRLNYNFQDSGRFGNHGQGIQGGDPTFALVNSSGEPCWNNPVDGAINLPNLKNSYPFSMAAWINISQWSTSADNDLIMNLSIGGQRVSLTTCTWSSATSDGMDFYIMYGGSGHHYFRPSSRPTNEWIHVVYSVVSSNNTAHRVYQNGSNLTTTGNRGGGHGGSAGWAIGGNAANSERFGIGRIGSIRFFNKALSSSEASALYTNDTFYT